MSERAQAGAAEAPQKKIDDLMKSVPVSAEEERVLGAEDVDDEPEAPEAAASDVPDWVVLPGGLKMPEGRQVAFVRFRAKWTDRPARGDRQCVLWNLTEADEKLALKRTRGEPLRTIDELTKQTIRVVDGARADWTTGKSNVDLFWNEIGARCRQQLKNIYVKTHTLEAAEMADFFTNCVAVRSVGG